jgi:hypothetical protein
MLTSDYQNLHRLVETNDGFWSYETEIQRVVPGANLLIPAGSGVNISGFLKFRSGTAGRPVIQTAARIFAVMLTA